MVKFSLDFQGRIFEAAMELRKAGLYVDTVLPNSRSVFGSFGPDVDAECLLTSAPVESWQVDV